jgi:hypothetical protein
MPQLGTSGSMSGDGKRSVAEWPKLPRPSSTLPKPTSSDVRSLVAIRGKRTLGGHPISVAIGRVEMWRGGFR